MPTPLELAAERCRQWHLTNNHLCSQTEIQPSNVLRVETQLASIFIPRTDLRYLVLFPPCVWRARAVVVCVGLCAMLSRWGCRDPYKTNTMKTLDQVKEWASLDWDSYFAALKVRPHIPTGQHAPA